MEMIAQWLPQGWSVVVPFIVLLGVLIFVHELGHFSVAKYFGVRVEIFSLGFGRKLLQKKVGDTIYCISMIPFGGYVKMYGDDMNADIPEEQKKFSFTHQPVLPRIAIVLAGPLMNAFFAVVLFTAIGGIGEEVLSPKLGDIFQDSAAYSAGFRKGDIIKEANGQTIDRWDTFKKTIEDNASKEVAFKVQRGTEEVIIKASPVEILNKNVLSTKSHVGQIDGLNYLNRASMVGLPNPLSEAYKAGLRTGDLVTTVDGKAVQTWEDLVAALNESAKAKKSTVSLAIERGELGKKLTLNIPINPKNPTAEIEPSDLYLSNVLDKSAAQEAGVQTGDRLVAINGKKLVHWEDVVKLVQNYKENSGSLKVEFLRSGKPNSVDVVPRLISQTDGAGVETKNFALGVVTGLAFASPDTFIFKHRTLSGLLSYGVNETVHWTKLTALSFWKLVRREVSAKSIGGPLMIGKLASDTWRIGISPFLKIMAIISINLFLLNLMPIPVLDGGHLLFFSIEFVKGSPLSFRKIEVLQQIGMFLLLGLMAFSMFNDIVRFFTT